MNLGAKETGHSPTSYKRPYLGYKLSVLLVQVGCGCHVVLPDADLAFFSRSGEEPHYHHEC